LARERLFAGRFSFARGHVRRGITFEAVAWSLVLAGSLATAAVVITPRVIRADDAAGSGAAHAAARVVPAHQKLLDELAALVRQCHAVIEVRARGSGPFASIALWLTDETNPGRLDPEELAVISHSRTVQTLMCHVLDEESLASLARRDAVSGRDLPRADRAALARSLTAAVAAGESLPDFWRRQHAVVSRVFAREISDARFELLPRAAPGDSTRRQLRITLTWPADSADGSDVASTSVDVLCSSNAPEILP
jgi:hypothetical protein